VTFIRRASKSTSTQRRPRSSLARRPQKTATSDRGRQIRPLWALAPAIIACDGFKLDQLLAEPFQSFYAALIRRIYETDAILVGGYGFGDVHVNRALQNRPEGPGPRAPVMVLTRSACDTMPMELRRDEWGFKVGLVLHAPAQYREPGHRAAPDIAELIAKNGFEVCSSNRVAIWHSGFVEATRRLGAIVDWLDGSAGDGVLAGTKP
jgi:hypothetical protein